MTASCAVAKFRWVLARVEHELAQGTLVKRVDRVGTLMNEVYVGEMDERTSRQQTHDTRGDGA